MKRPSLSNAIRRPAPSQLEPRKGSNARDAGTRDAGPIGPAAACAAVRSAPGRDRAESRPYTHFAGKDKQTRVVRWAKPQQFPSMTSNRFRRRLVRNPAEFEAPGNVFRVLTSGGARCLTA